MSLKLAYPFIFTSNEGNIVTFKLEHPTFYAKVYVLEDDIVRVRFTKEETPVVEKTWLVAPGMSDVPKEGRHRDDLSVFSLPSFTAQQQGEQFIIETAKLKATITLDGFKIRWEMKQADGSFVEIAKDRYTQAYNFDGSLGEGTYHYLTRTRDEQYYGLGEKSGTTNRYGKRYRMLNVDPMGYDAETTDPLYKHIPFYITRNMNTNVSFGIFYDTMAKCTFDMGQEMDNYHGFYRYYQSAAHDLDYYIIAGPAVKDVVTRYSWLTGQTIFPPKWSLGYSGSTMTFTDAPDAQVQMNKFIDNCETHDIICDSFQLSSGYTSIDDKRYVFNWNYDKFPSPKEFITKYHNNGLRLCANIKPALLVSHPQFNKLKENNMFIFNNDNEIELAQFWDEIGAYVDFTNEDSFNWWKNEVTEKLLQYGIDSTWNDNNEYEIWSSNVKINGFGQEADFEQYRSIQTLLMMKASFEAQREFAPNLRPYLISRSGTPGMQRYVQTWSGDNYTSWKTLKYNIKMGLGLSLSGVYNIGHDVGGFSGPAPEPELLIRWVQNGILHPRFTIHSWNEDQSVNLPWMYDEATDIIRETIQLRHQLVPYFYNLLYKAHTSYEPIIKPTFYNYEYDTKTFEENDDFILGNELLVASVVEKGQRERPVYLPNESEGWYDFYTGEWYAGGQTVIVEAPLHRIPLLVKGGAVIPLNTAQASFKTKHLDERTVCLYPHKENGTTVYRLYEDDGLSVIDEQSHAFIVIEMVTTENEIIVNVSKEGSYKLPYDDISFVLPATETRPLTINNNVFNK